MKSIYNPGFENRIVLNYLLFGLFWIFFSDKILDFLVSSNPLLARIHSYKGAFFIFFTTILLYYFVHRHTNSVREINAQLVDGEIRYKALFQDNLSVMIMIDPDTGNIRDANQAACRYYGWSMEELCSMNLCDINRLPLENLLKELANFKLGKSDHLFSQHRLSGGEVRDVEIFGGPIQMDQSVWLYAIVHDITLRRDLERSLLANRQKLEVALSSMGDAIFISDAEGQIVDYNDAFSAFFKFKDREECGKCLNDNPDFFEIFQDKDYLLPADQWTVSMALRGETGTNAEYIVKRKDSSETWVGSFSFAPIRDGRGVVVGSVVTCRDVTARKNAEESIKQSEAELNYAQEIAKMGSWELDLVTNKYTWSKNMFALLGISTYEKEFFFDKFISLVHPDDRSLIDMMHQEIVTSKSSVNFDFRFILPDGQIKWVQNIVEPVYTDGKLVKLYGINLDITDKKRVEIELIQAREAAESSSRLKTAFINNISHEIRTPLNAILGFTQIIIDPSLENHEKLEFIEILNTSSTRLLQTITDYMDISMLASGNFDSVKKSCSPYQIILEVKEKFHSRITEKGLNLKTDIPELIQFQKEDSDHAILVKILSHLVDNAIKFTKEGAISIGLKNVKDGVEFFVSDTGIGIKHESLSRIFNHFVQEDDSNSRAYEGSGLGLAIVQGLVELLGGTLRFESELGRGSTFAFFIPRENGSSRLIPQQIASEKETNIQRPLILIAEDDDSSFRLLERILKNSYQVLRAEDGNKAVEIIRQKPEVRLILMDVKLPGMNGYEATKLIRAFNKEVVVVAQTANGLAGDRERSLEAGCNDYISKPIHLKELTSMLQRLLG